MNSIHDMGGMHGFGPIEREENEPVFHEAWEGRVYAMATKSNFVIPGGSRYAIERMDPAHYLNSSYYEKWLHVRIQSLIESGTLTQAEFDERLAHFVAHPHAEPPRRDDPEATADAVSSSFTPVTHIHDVEIQPAFELGDRVRARNMHPAGHTRLPRYVRGRNAVVVKYYGVQDFDDTVVESSGAHTALRADPQPLYCVRFEGAELWGESAEPKSAVYLDMWESYLERREDADGSHIAHE